MSPQLCARVAQLPNIVAIKYPVPRQIYVRAVSASLQPVWDAFNATKPGGKPQAHGKYWQELLGQTGGVVRPPLLQLTQAEKTDIHPAIADLPMAPAHRFG